MKITTTNICFNLLYYALFVALYCKGSSIAPLTDYANNEIYQELHRLDEYFSNSDEKLFIDLRRSKGYTNELIKLSRDDSDITLTINFKDAATQRMRLRVTGYYQEEYLYSLSKEGLIKNYKDYSINKQKNIIS